MDPVRYIASRTVVLPNRDIDTDQIIPARYLTTTTRESFSDALFHDLRFDSKGDPISDFPLNQPAAKGCSVLVAGNNFGCGSSREHAPWALLDFGIEAVISTEIADIFSNNALKNGLLPIVVDAVTHTWLLANPGAEVRINVEDTTLTLPGGQEIHFSIDAFSRYCLLEGLDQLGYIRQHEDAIKNFEKVRSWKP